MLRHQSSWYKKGYTQEWWAGLERGERERFLSTLSDEEVEDYFHDWRVWAHDYQLPPDPSSPLGDWDTWLFLAGRGSGKTRSAVEYITDAVKDGWARRIAIVGQGQDDVRNVMVEGDSGFLQCAPKDLKPRFYPAAGGGKLIWPNGCQAFIYSAVDTEALRGPQFHLGWFDEPMAVPRVQRERALDNLEFCLRLGNHPRLILTTTPKKDQWLRQMELDSRDPVNKIHISRATTHDNAANLAANFLRKIDRKYGKTRIGKQEIMGEILGDDDNALWTEEVIDSCRLLEDDPVEFAATCEKIIVSIDPNTRDEAGKAVKTSHAAGIVVVGKKAGEYYVLGDRSTKGGPSKWGKAAVKAAIEFDADEYHVESNQGGDMVKAVIKQAMLDPDLVDEAPEITIHLTFSGKSKEARAEPVSTAYQRGVVHHVGPKLQFELMETQMLYLHEGQGQDPTKEDYDRCDAMVGGLTRLGIKKGRKKRVRTTGGHRRTTAGIMSMDTFANGTDTL